MATPFEDDEKRSAGPARPNQPRQSKHLHTRPFDPAQPTNEGPASREAAENSPAAGVTKPNTTDTSAPQPAPQYPTAKNRQIGRGLRGYMNKHKRGGLITGGITAALIAALVSFLLVLPLKAIFFLTIIHNKAFGSSQGIVEKYESKLLSKYVERRMETTGAKWGNPTRNVVATGNPLHDFYDNWAASKFEKDFSDKYGLSFERVVVNGRYNVNVIENGVPLQVGVDGKNISLENLSNNQFRTVIKDATAKETHFWQIYKRRHVRLALYEKYGVKKWIFFSGALQAGQDARIAAKKAVQRKFNELAVKPVSAKLGSYFDCVISGKCDDIDSPNPGNEAAGGDAGTKGADTAENAAADELDKKESDAVIHTVVNRLVGEEVGNTLMSALGGVGGGIKAILALVHIGDAVKTGGTLEKITIAKNSLQYAGFFAANATAINQIMAGEALTGPKPAAQAAVANFSATQIFSGMKSFVAADTTPANAGYTQVDAFNEQIGDATKSRVYQKYYAGVDTTKAKSDITCDGQPIAADQVVCPDKMVKPPLVGEIQNNPFAQLASNVSDQYNALPDIVKTAVNAPQAAIDFILRETGLNSILSGGFSAILKGTGAQDLLSQGFSALMNHFFGFVITGTETGASWFDGMQAGADVSAAQSAQDQLGGRPLSTAEQQAWAAQAQNEEVAKTDGLSGVWYKISSLDTSNSIAARLVAWSPSNLGELPGKTAGVIVGLLNPNTLLKNITYLGGVIIPGNHIAFADAPYVSPFGVQSMGYTINDPVFSADPEETAARCKEGSPSRQAIEKLYNDQRTDYASSGGKTPWTATDPCLLLDTATNVGGAYFNNDDNGGLQSAIKATNGTTSGGVGAISGDRAALNQQLYASGKFSIQNASAKNDINDGVVQDSLVRLLVAITTQGNFTIIASALKSDHDQCSRPGANSNHYYGLAVDISNHSPSPAADIYTWLYNNRAALNIDELIHSPIPAGTSTLKHGQPGNYDATTLGEHRDHIHVSVNGPAVPTTTASSGNSKC